MKATLITPKSPINPLKRLLLTASIATAYFVSVGTGAAATTIFSDDFTGVAASSGQTSTGLNGDGWYSFNNATGGAAWTTTTDNTSPLSGTVLSNPGGSSSNTVLFKQFDAITLDNIGESITLTLNFHAKNASSAFQVSLLGSAQTLTNNSYGTNVLTDATGYGFIEGTTVLRAGYTTANLGSLWEVTSNSPLPWATKLSDVSVSTPLDTSAHTFVLTLTKTAAGIAINSSYDSTVFDTYYDTTGSIYTSFNTVRLGGSASTSGFNVDNIALTTVPEPATWSMIVGGLGMMALAQRARRRMS